MLLWMEGFDSFGSGTHPSPVGSILRKYDLGGKEDSMYMRAGRLGGQSIQMVWDGYCYLRTAGLTTDSTMIVGFAMKLPVRTNNKQFFLLMDGTTTSITIETRSDGELNVVDKFYSGSVIGTTSGAGILDNTWCFVEIKVVCHATEGSIVVRVNENTVLTLTDIDTQPGANAYHDRFQFLGSSTDSDHAPWIDDIYCLDSTGGSNDNFIGNSRVTLMNPDVTVGGDFTPSADTNYECVDESPADDDTSYVESSTSGHTDLYNYTTPSVSYGIVGCQVNTVCRETDGTPFSLKTVCSSNGTASEDAGQAIGTTDYVSLNRIVEVDPDTTTAWTFEGLNAALFGIKVV